MALQISRVPILDPATGRFPTAYEDPQTASDKAAAEAARDAAAGSASTATTKAGEASGSAGVAATQAGISTTKAGEAADSAASASGSAGTATTQAGIATTAAGDAETARAAAVVAREGAETARTGAETAQSTVAALNLTASATTLAAGAPATAVVSGSLPDLVLDVGVPVGQPTAYELRGTGNPNGVQAAGLRVYYTDTAATNGAVRWRKDTASGNTGWVCVEGDTGWIDISTSLVNGWTGTILIRRTASSAEMLVHGLNASAATATTVIDLPVGYRPSSGSIILDRPVFHTTALVLRRFTLATPLISASTVPFADSLFGGYTWIPGATWPTA